MLLLRCIKSDEHEIRIEYGTAMLLRVIKELLKIRVDVAEVDSSIYVSEDVMLQLMLLNIVG